MRGAFRVTVLIFLGVMVGASVPSARAILSSSPRTQTWTPNGTVNALACTSDTVYLGGSFTRFAPDTGNSAILDCATGFPLLRSLPRVRGSVYACAPDGAGGWFIGGSLSAVGNEPRSGLAHIKADGSVDKAWNPGPNGVVSTLALSGSTLYVGGNFTSVGGKTRNNIAALDAATGAATEWDPNADSYVSALVVSGGRIYVGGGFSKIGGLAQNRLAVLDAESGWCVYGLANVTGSTWGGTYITTLALSGSTLYVGGSFSQVGGLTRLNLAAIDIQTRLVLPWNPQAKTVVPYTTAAVWSLAVSGATVFAGGDFATVGGQARNGLAAIDANTGSVTAWDPDPSYYGQSATVQALVISGNTLYVGGKFSNLGGQSRQYLGAVDCTTGLATNWSADANDEVSILVPDGSHLYAGGRFSSVGAQSRNHLAALDIATGDLRPWNPNANDVVNVMAARAGRIYAGGNFTFVGGVTRNRLAALDAVTGQPTAWDPNADSEVDALAVSDSSVFAGGAFSNIGKQARHCLAELDTTTGLATNWQAEANGNVRVLALAGPTLYAGGDFTSLAGQTRHALAALDARSGALTSWAPEPAGIDYAPPLIPPAVYALAVTSSTVYVGGIFGSIGGQTRDSIAALDAATGAALPWVAHPIVNDIYYSAPKVRALALMGASVLAGGRFSSMEGQSQPSNLAALDPITGALLPCNAVINSVANFTSVYALGISNRTLSIGGNFDYAGFASHPYFVQFDDVPVAPSHAGVAALSSDTLTCRWTDNSDDELGFRIWLDAGSGAPLTQRAVTAPNVTSYTLTGLTPNTFYTFQVASMRAENDSDKTAPCTTCTLAAPPTPGLNVTCDKPVNVTQPEWTVFTFRNPAGFGPGSDGGSRWFVTGFRTIWDAVPTHLFKGDEPAWDNGPLTFTPLASGAYYLHLQSLNQAGAATSTTLDLGPFKMDTTQKSDPATAMWWVASEPTTRQQLSGHTVVWTGSRALIWGGRLGGWNARTPTNQGWIFNPADRSFTPMSLNGAPGPRYDHTAVWTGQKMIIWGGRDQWTTFSDGAGYDPATDSWSAVTSTGQPTGRAQHTAVWTGDRMIVWGGFNASISLNSGAKYDPAKDTWSPINPGPLYGREKHSAVWTGQSMIIWGGSRWSPLTYFNNGASYDPGSDTWTLLPAAPLAGRDNHTALWSGSEMLILGGGAPAARFADGAAFNPGQGSWRALDLSSVPGRAQACSVFTSSTALYWGGAGLNTLQDTGLDINPLMMTPSGMPATGAPTARVEHQAVWAGSDYGMLVFGGLETDYNRPRSYAIYRPAVLPAGSVQVALVPAEAVTAGAAWRWVGSLAWLGHGDLASAVPAGSRQIEFKSLPGWSTPSTQTVPVIKGQTTQLSGTYVLQTGSLQVTLAPDAAVAAGARWRRVGTTPWLASGAIEAGVPVGSCSVEFKPVSGWQAPATIVSQILLNQVLQVSKSYRDSRSSINEEQWGKYR